MLLAEGDKLVTSDRVMRATKSLNKPYVRSLRYLLEHGYLMRIFRGVFYVNSEEERESGTQNRPLLRIVSEALALKSVKHWYLGLETALRINGLTHEYFAVNYVITDSYRTTKVIKIGDSKFQFLRWSAAHFASGITRRFDLKFSDREKTILDLVYKRYLDTRDERIAISPIVEYGGMLDNSRLSLYLEEYPKKVREMVRRRL